jgi:tetratricopeptide (TPR) repeat protein
VRLCSRSHVSLATALVVALNASAALAAPPKRGAPKAAPPKAAPPAPKATASTKAYDEGVALFRADNYEGALAIFKKLTTIEARRGAAFALDKLGRTDEAIAEFEAFIAGAPASLDDQVKAARTRVAELVAAKAKAQKVHVVTVPPGATIEVEGVPGQSGKSPIDLDLPPGKHVVRATLAGNQPAEQEIVVTAGSSVPDVHLDLAPTSAGLDSLELVPPLPRGSSDLPLPAPSQPGVDRLGAPILTGVLGGLSFGAGVYFGLSALNKKSDYDAQPTPANLADAETDAAFSTAGLAAGAVLGVVTVVLLLTTPSGDSAPAKSGATSVRSNGLRVRF